MAEIKENCSFVKHAQLKMLVPCGLNMLCAIVCLYLHLRHNSPDYACEMNV